MSAQRRLPPDLHLLSTSTEAPVVESGPHETRILRRHARDLTAVLALPAMWHGREPAYIMGSLLDVLLSLLRLDSAYVRFDDPDGGPAIEDWRPQSPDGGRLWLESTPGRGCHVLYRAAHGPARGRTAGRKALKVLVVDDDQSIVDALKA
jgi:hypothetical protein